MTRDQARTIINAAATITHRLLLETLWQSGGRVTEVLRLRPCDLDPGAPILHLNQGQVGSYTVGRLKDDVNSGGESVGCELIDNGPDIMVIARNTPNPDLQV